MTAPGIFAAPAVTAARRLRPKLPRPRHNPRPHRHARRLLSGRAAELKTLDSGCRRSGSRGLRLPPEWRLSVSAVDEIPAALRIAVRGDWTGVIKDSGFRIGEEYSRYASLFLYRTE